MYVLIVGETTKAASLMRTFIEEMNHIVQFAKTGAEALEMARSQQCDLMLLNIFLSDGFGYDFIPQIRRYQPDVPIITMTDYNTPEIESNTRKRGVSFYMAKPVNLIELKEIVDHLSRKAKRIKEFY